MDKSEMDPPKPNFKAKVTCCDCGQEVVHVCDAKQANIREAIMKMLTWSPEFGRLGDEEFHQAFLAHGRRSGWIEKDKEGIGEGSQKGLTPYGFFGSQTWSYPLLGSKDTARSFHCYIQGVIRACGFEPYELELEAERRIDKEREEQLRRREWDHMRRTWKPLNVKKKLKLMDAARTEAAATKKLPEPLGTDSALLALARKTFPKETEVFHQNVSRYAKIHADFYDRDGHDSWMKDKN